MRRRLLLVVLVIAAVTASVETVETVEVGTCPAQKAAALDPIDALRYEQAAACHRCFTEPACG